MVAGDKGFALSLMSLRIKRLVGRALGLMGAKVFIRDLCRCDERKETAQICKEKRLLKKEESI